MAFAGDRMDAVRFWSVSELIGLARERLESSFSETWVRGELSNCKAAPSGHVYFVLKDSACQMRSVMWKTRAMALRCRLEDGLEVLARGTLTVYPARGDMQFNVSVIEPVGAGMLALAFSQLKARLELEGLFAVERKRLLPLRPRRIGVVTSPTGAAIRDILQVLGRRHASIPILIAPVRVQGEGASAEIARAIERINRVPDIDVLIVGRGGGSIEDLWCFNEEVVARAIARSRVPVISAVGHETDFTIADFVADVRAPTPSAAAETVVAAAFDLRARIESSLHRLRAAAQRQTARLLRRLAVASRARALLSIAELPERSRERVDDLHARLGRAFERRLERASTRLAAASAALTRLDVRARLASDRRRLSALEPLLAERTRSQLARRRAGFAQAVARLEALSPLAVLARGYSLARLPDGSVLRSALQIERGEALHLTLSEGGLLCRVEERKP